MPNLPKSLPGSRKNSGNCNMLLVTSYRYFDELTWYWTTSQIDLEINFFIFQVNLFQGLIFDFKESGGQVSFVIPPTCKVTKNIFEIKLKGFLCWWKTLTTMFARRRRSTSIKRTKSSGLWQKSERPQKENSAVPVRYGVNLQWNSHDRVLL